MNRTELIPKTIHYFWFGKKPKSELINRCISSWGKYASDFEIIEWNEDNFDVFSSHYSAQAYRSGKYAFVSDYARLKVLFEHGGFYLDTDVELLRGLDDLRNQEVLLGFEPDNLVGPGCIIGAKSGNAFIGELLDKYSSLSFRYKGHLNLTTIGEYTTALLLKKGLKLSGEYQRLGSINIYPSEVFCPYNSNTGKLNVTADTYSIHHFEASWKADTKTQSEIKLREVRQRIKLRLLSLLGEHNFFRIKYLLRVCR